MVLFGEVFWVQPLFSNFICVNSIADFEEESSYPWLLQISLSKTKTFKITSDKYYAKLILFECVPYSPYMYFKGLEEKKVQMKTKNLILSTLGINWGMLKGYLFPIKIPFCELFTFLNQNHLNVHKINSFTSMLGKNYLITRALTLVRDAKLEKQKAFTI